MSRVMPILWVPRRRPRQLVRRRYDRGPERGYGRLAVAGDDSVDNAFEGGFGCTHGGEVPQHGL